MRPALAPILALPLVLGLAPSAAARRSPPQEHGAQQAQRPPVYDEQADAGKDIAAALARAQKDNKRVLIQWGANWCGWCKLLHDTFTSDAEVKKELLYEYEVVYVDVGKMDKNMELAARYGAELKGIPFLTVLDGGGQVLANQETGSLEQGKAHDPKKVLAFLSQHRAEYQDAQQLLAGAKAAAAKDGKRVFVHFGAPWCSWCRRLEAWLERPAVKALLAKDFVELKLDVDRTKGGKEILAGLRGGEQGGIPWFAFLDGDKVLAHSGAAADNLGFPWKDEEIEQFGKLLSAAAKSLKPEDVAALQADLRAFRKESEDAAKAKSAQGSGAG